ncbi:MAG: prolyl-tRNA synthetase associated domain-containing protein [Hyphomicrobiaceae bacterium]|nr:MAG: prolyl-tRNA synthetase associated domain-containing protein [Hyphomicrobiaceae bacterium]
MPFNRQDLFARLGSLGIKTKTVDHVPVFTVAESTKLERDIEGGHTKNLFLKCKKGNLYLVVALNNARIDLKTLHNKLGSGRLSFGSADLLVEVLGITPGSVTPFALVNDSDRRVNVVLDEPMMRYDLLNYHPLSNDATTTIARDDLLRFIRACGHEPRIMAVSETAVGEPA